jgi:hypothetical protein
MLSTYFCHLIVGHDAAYTFVERSRRAWIEWDLSGIAALVFWSGRLDGFSPWS